LFFNDEFYQWLGLFNQSVDVKVDVDTYASAISFYKQKKLFTGFHHRYKQVSKVFINASYACNSVMAFLHYLEINPKLL
jgi:hypothetical protein